MTTLVPGLELVVEAGVATLTFNRADKLNSLTFEMYRKLVSWFAEIQHDDAIKVVVVTGTGRGFCSGGDVHEIIGELVNYGAAEMTGFARMTGDVIRNMRRLKKPIIAAINGTAAGAGAVIALASDLRLCASNAKIAFLFTKVGLTGADMGAAYLLPRVVGLGKASELLMFGDAVPAEEGLRLGLFNKVVAPEALGAEAQAWAKRLVEGPSFSLGMTKELLNNGLNLDLDTALDAEARAQTICMLGQDFKEFHASFVEKRPARFTGK
ncbi:MAG: enoyl-CoA hydratase family protein [Deltaproteobacteria bacterium]|nr:enoyl-CoA hydratase family protein [Deltaproteobacteria bacterium]